MRRTLLLALLVLLPACGGDRAADPLIPAASEASPDPADAHGAGAGAGAAAGAGASTAVEERLLAAARATTDAGSARTTLVATLTDLPGRPGPVTLTGSGTADFAGGRMHSNIDLSEAFDPPPTKQPGRELPSSWETISADGVVYLRAAMLSDLLGIETPWLRIDPSSERLADGLSPLGRVAASDGGAPLALLAGLDRGSATDLGTEDVRGTATTHLRATVDLLAAVHAGDDPSEAEARTLERFVDGLGARALTVDAFLDGDDRVHRLVYSHDLAPETGGGSQRVELEYTDFGTPVDITVPASDQVSDLVEIFGGP